MNREKEYAYAGAILGASAVFGIGFVPASRVLILIEEADGGIPFLLVFFLLVFGVPIIAGMIPKEWSWSMAIVFFFVGVVSLIVASNALGWISSLFLTLPFAVLGGVIGYGRGSSTGKKADERAYAELEKREQERERLEQKKAKIIAMIDEVLSK